MPELQIALVDGTLYASTVLAESTDDDVLAAVGACLLDALDLDPELDLPSRLKPLEWMPPTQ